jgi:TM2 domain-containing membrane protein YozV
VNKSKTTTTILCFLFGYLGAHRFYTGHMGTGAAQLLTGGGLGIWWLVDFVQILRGKFLDASGRSLA